MPDTATPPAPATDPPAPATPAAPSGASPTPAAPATAPEEQTVEAWKKHTRTWEDRANADKARAEKAEAELTKLRERTQSAEEKALDDAKAEGRKEAEEKSNDKLVRSAVKTVATGVLADPADAIAFLDLKAFKVDDNGDVDEKAIKKALDQLLEDKPHLAAKGNKGANLHQGARGPSTELDPNEWMRRQARR